MNSEIAEDRRVNILDATPLLLKLIPPGRNITCSHVIAEIKNTLAQAIVSTHIECGNIKLEEPEDEDVKKVYTISELTGDYKNLSLADIHVIALAIKYTKEKYEVTVYTDDFSIQNIMKHLKIPFIHCIREVKRPLKWVLKCRYCGKVYKFTYVGDRCEDCGGPLVRSPAKRH
ncbi:MAG: NOB1 family endonuclease [Candidatus Geothermarchaeota archaeon]